jgi:hypothetical protein
VIGIALSWKRTAGERSSRDREKDPKASIIAQRGTAPTGGYHSCPDQSYERDGSPAKSISLNHARMHACELAPFFSSC